MKTAHAWVVNEEALIKDMQPFPTGRVAELIALVDALEGPQVDDGDMS